MCNSSPDLQRQDQPTSVWANASRLPLPYQSVTLKYFSKFSGRKHCQQKSEDKIPWLFPDLRKEIRFPWPKSKFPDNSLTLNFFFHWLFTDCGNPGTVKCQSCHVWVLRCWKKQSATNDETLLTRKKKSMRALTRTRKFISIGLI